ncbi:MAG: dihydrodipicolinate synthase family protein [SAR116 cluster bacterium]|nr:dihydrodipicolinate synthase family protein [SAR116 cluster bacterium]RPH08996.1 MAG: dihydrodipicolinate synthase family protein [Alphaproteobacteria bacterium TMED54]|tara:strand:- start:604 stop:1518 length:915 start_codon:yes stop_codon:yes gene_type:complete
MSNNFTGCWPVAPTPFKENEDLDIDGMKRVLDCMIDQKVDGICILANYSEQFLLSDDEREILTKLCIEHVAGRVPIIVTISHFSTDIVFKRAKLAKDIGADMVMMMPPYHGALLKGNADQTFEQFRKVNEAEITIMVQDAPLSGVDLGVNLLVKMAKEIENVKCFKIECAQAANKLRALIHKGGNVVEGPFDGEEGITLFEDLQAGARGNMSSAMLPDLIGPLVKNYIKGNIKEAEVEYNRVLPLINYENRQCGFRATKTVFKEGGVIKSDFCRHPIPSLDKETKKGLLDLANNYDLIAMKWGL